MTQVSISMDKGQWGRIRSELRKTPERMADVVSDAVFKTTNHVRVDMDRETRKEITVMKKTLHQKNVKTRFITQANWGRDYNRAGRVTGKGERIPLRFFKAQPSIVKGKGLNGKTKPVAVQYQIKKKGGRTENNTQMYIRKRKGGGVAVLHRPGYDSPRYPVKEIYGPSVYQVLEDTGAIPRLEKSGLDYMEKRIMQQLGSKLGWNKNA